MKTLTAEAIDSMPNGYPHDLAEMLYLYMVKRRHCAPANKPYYTSLARITARHLRKMR